MVTNHGLLKQKTRKIKDGNNILLSKRREYYFQRREGEVVSSLASTVEAENIGMIFGSVLLLPYVL
jgi:hypothetical protein